MTSAQHTSASERVNREAEQNKTVTKPRGSGEKIGKVTVTFSVTVPETTLKHKKSVWLTGTFHQINTKLKDWDPRAQQMKRVNNTTWTATWSGPAGTEIAYKYTLGDWEHVELDEHCHDVSNHHLTLHSSSEKSLNIVDHVPHFRGLDDC